MIWFIGVWATLHEIVAIKISKYMLTQREFNKIFWFGTPISPKKLSQHNKQLLFSESAKRDLLDVYM